MDLEALLRRIQHECGGEHYDRPLKIMLPDAELYDVLSLNWDGESGVWVLIADAE